MRTLEMSEVSEVIQREWPYQDTPQLSAFLAKSNFAHMGQRRIALKPFKEGHPAC